jgi:hypothetical protein
VLTELGGSIYFFTGHGIYEWDGSSDLPKPVSDHAGVDWYEFVLYGPEHDAIVENL